MRFRGLLLSIALYAGVAVHESVPMCAQQVQPVPVGDTVRVWAPRDNVKRVKATILPWEESTAKLLRLSVPTDSLDLPFSNITRLEVLRGRNTGRGILVGFGVGGTVGMLTGALIGAGAVSGCTGWFCEFDAFGYAAGGMLIGGVLGAVIGGANPPDRWTRVELPTWAGFPQYRKPFYETVAFKLALIVAPILFAAAIN